MGYRHLFSSLLLITLSVTACYGQNFEGQRQRFQEARRALKNGDLQLFHELSNSLRDYALYPNLRYDYLHTHLNEASTREIQEFVDAYPDSLTAYQLRAEWLKTLGDRGDWRNLVEYYTPQTDPVLRCHHVVAKLHTGADDSVYNEIEELWLIGKPQPQECDRAFDALLARSEERNELIWERIRLAMHADQPRLAQTIGQRLDEGERSWLTLWQKAHTNPGQVLHNEEVQSDSPRTQEIVAHATIRLAKKSAEDAYYSWQVSKRRYRFSATTAGLVERAIGIAADNQGMLRAVSWLDNIPKAAADDAEVQFARLHAGLIARDWKTLERWTRDPPAKDMEALRWQYWHGRALEEIGQRERAKQHFRTIAQEQDYYGFLAADRIGQSYRLRSDPVPSGYELEQENAKVPALLRIRELLITGYDDEAQKEWQHALNHTGSHQFRQVAALAYHWGWYNKVIAALGKAKVFGELELRFPTPFDGLVNANARANNMDAAIIYGIMRAESAFYERARSHAGALGLMQLMPGTGRDTARKLGFSLGSSADLLDGETNVKLGSSYLHDMLMRFDDNLAMAAAAYNAGPGRVRQWQPEVSCLPGDLWVELIPITETRKYARSVLFYTTVYQWRLGQEQRPMAARMNLVQPKDSSAEFACGPHKTHSYSYSKQ